jgi:hypothetical protein
VLLRSASSVDPAVVLERMRGLGYVSEDGFMNGSVRGGSQSHTGEGAGSGSQCYNGEAVGSGSQSHTGEGVGSVSQCQTSEGIGSTETLHESASEALNEPSTSDIKTAANKNGRIRSHEQEGSEYGGEGSVDADDSTRKRRKNTESARKSRMRKQEKV